MPNPQTFTLAEVKKIVAVELAKRYLNGKPLRKTVVRFAEKADRPLKPGEPSQPWEIRNNGQPAKPPEQAKAIRPGAVVNLVGKFADRMPGNIDVVPGSADDVTEDLDPNERQEMLERLADLDPNLTPDQFATVSDKTLVPIHNMIHKLAGKDAPSTKQRLRKLCSASPQGKAIVDARQKAKVAKHASVDDGVMPPEQAVVADEADNMSARKFSERPGSDHGRTRKYHSAQRSVLTPARRQQLLAATPAGKVALKRMGK